MPMTWPGSTRKSTPFKAWTPGKRLSMPSITRAASCRSLMLYLRSACRDAVSRRGSRPTALLDLLAPNTVFLHFLAVDVLLIDNDRRVEKLLRGLLAFVELLVYELHGGLGHPDGVLAYRRGLLTLADGL